MKTGEENFLQRFLTDEGRGHRWGQAFDLIKLGDSLPAISAKLSKLSVDRMFPICVPLVMAAISMFLEKVAAGIKGGQALYGITDLTEMPFRSDRADFLYTVFVVDGKIVVARGDLADINSYGDNDVVIGLTRQIVFWGPQKETKKLFNAFVRFVKEAGFEQVEKKAAGMLAGNKKAAKNLPPLFQKFYSYK